MNLFLDWLNHSHLRTIAVALLCLVVTALVDFSTGYQMAFHLFYAIPVLLIAWRYGLPGAMAAAAGCAIVWTVTGPLSGLVYQNTLNPYWNFTMRLSILAIIGYLVCSYRMTMLTERRLSRTDSLTELANRRHFIDTLEIELKRSLRYHHPFTLLYIDVDNFKTLNDTRGHAVGDSALCAIAQLLAREIRAGDMAARLGGDEFAVLLIETDAELAIKTAGRLFDKLTSMINAQDWLIGISVGLAVFRELNATATDVLKAADRVMYKAKLAGKNQLSCALFSQSLEAFEAIEIPASLYPLTSNTSR